LAVGDIQMPLLFRFLVLAALLSSHGGCTRSRSAYPLRNENESEASKNISHQNLLGPALNVTVRAGENALLACLAPHLGEKTVSWIRRTDLAILTSGRHVYTSDTRFSSIHPESSDFWGLQISPVRYSDQGIYECQVNTEPKMSRPVILMVLELDLRDSPKVPKYSSPQQTLKITGPTKTTTMWGSTYITLSCTINLSKQELIERDIILSWWHDGVQLQDDKSSKDLALDMVYDSSFSALKLQLSSQHTSHTKTYFCRAETKDYHHPFDKTVLKQISIAVNGVPSKNPVKTLIAIICVVKMYLS